MSGDILRSPPRLGNPRDMRIPIRSADPLTESMPT
jgi:hypothetical protein